MQAAIAARVVPLAFAAKLEFDSGPVRLWTGVGDRTILGEVYTGAGNLLVTSPISEVSEVRAEGVVVQLSGLDPALVSLALAEPYQGRRATLYLVVLVGGPHGAAVSDPVVTFRGRMDLMEIEEGGATATIALTVESNLLDLDRALDRRHTDQDQQQEFPGDRFFEYVPRIQDKEIDWR